MATYRGTKPEQTGDIRKDVSRLFNAFYDADEELRYLFGHIDTENLTDRTYEVIADKVFADSRLGQYLTGSDYEKLEARIAEKFGSGDVIPVANGGTGAKAAEAALQNLGLIASVGETININTNQCYTGYISSDTTAITFSVPLPKWLPSNAASVTVNSLRMNIRKVGGGYIGGSSSFVSGGFEYIGNTNYTVSVEISTACRHMILITLKNNASTMDTQNNTPVSLVGTVKLKIN